MSPSDGGSGANGHGTFEQRFDDLAARIGPFEAELVGLRTKVTKVDDLAASLRSALFTSLAEVSRQLTDLRQATVDNFSAVCERFSRLETAVMVGNDRRDAQFEAQRADQQDTRAVVREFFEKVVPRLEGIEAAVVKPKPRAKAKPKRRARR